MDRVLIFEHLARAERHVSQGEGHLARQLRIIGELEQRGLDTRQAKALLKTLQDAQALHISGRDRLREQATAAT